jgi:hypothetical protein
VRGAVRPAAGPESDAPVAQGRGFGGLILGAVDTDSLAMTLRHADTRAKPGHVC